MTPQELKNSILQLAIQGKLVEQRPEEGTAEELYISIQAECKDASSSRKREKTQQEIAEEEKQFEIPESWRWVRLGTLLRVVSGVSYDKKDVSTSGYRVLRGGNIQDMKVLLEDDDVFLPETYRDEEKLIQKGDILIVASTGSKAVIGKAGYVDRSIPDTMIGAFLRICRPFSSLTANYLCVLFDSEFYRKHIRSLAQGTNINNIKEAYITEFVVPLPPLAEQKRIVAKIEELLPLIDRYEKAWSRLEDFNKRFPADMQKSLLQLAIQGKLVEQRPEEGTGEELYEQIQAEKQKLIKEGKIKCDKRLADEKVILENFAIDIPDTWKLATLGSILNKLTDGTHKTPKYSTNGVKFISVKDMSSGVLSLENTKFITPEEHSELYTRCDPARGDMLLSKVGTTGVPAIVNTDEPFSLFVSVALLKYDHQFIDERFLYYLLQSPLVQSQAAENTRGVGNKNWVLDAIAKTAIVLPPLSEQKRIATKLTELLPLCDKLA